MAVTSPKGIGLSVLLLISSALPGCFLTRLASQLGDGCSVDDDCPSGLVCWENPWAEVTTCADAAYAACIDRGSPYEDCRVLLGDAGTADFDATDLADSVDMDAHSIEDLSDARDMIGDAPDATSDREDFRDHADVTADSDRDSGAADSNEDADSPALAPEAEPDVYSLTGGASLNVPNPGVLTNDRSFAGPLSALLESSTNHGSLTLAAGGGFSYTHDGGQSTTDGFAYRASDGGVVSEPVTVMLLINVSPVASQQNVIVPEGATVTIVFEAVDANDDDLTYRVVSQPSEGQLTDLDAIAGTVCYTPDTDFTGTDVLTFRANDGELDSNEAAVTLSVNGAPGYVALPSEVSTLANRTLGPLEITVADPDADPGDLTLTASSDRQDIVADSSIAVAGSGANRALTLITEPDQAGVVTLSLELSDGSSVVAAEITVHVGVTHDLDDVADPGSLRGAFEIANNGDTITFDPAHFNATASEAQRTITLLSEVVVDRDLRIFGTGRDSVILSGNDAVRILFVDDSVTLDLSQLTLTHGRASGSGLDGRGGAIRTDGGAVLASDVTLSDNSAEEGAGAIFVGSTAQFACSTCQFLRNSSESGLGGAIRNDGGAVSLDRCSLSDNVAIGGGALRNSGTVSINSSTFSGNSAEGASGGAVQNSSGGAVTFLNSTISNNSASLSGGGVFNLNASSLIRLSFCTLVGNTADVDGTDAGAGGGLSNFSGTTLLSGTIIAGNLRGSVGEEVSDDITSPVSIDPASSFNLVGDPATSDVLENGVNGNVVGVDWSTVLDSTLIGNGGPTQTHALINPGSALDVIPEEACVDSDANTLVVDQRGEPRPSGASCDIGAFERQPEDP